MCVLAVKMGRREDLGYPQPSAPSPPRRASRAAYGYEYGYEWYGYAYQGLWYAYCATMLLSDNNTLNRRAIKGTSTFTCLNLPSHLTGKHACLIKGIGTASNPEEAPALNF